MSLDDRLKAIRATALDGRTNALAALDAVEAVLKLHQPKTDGPGSLVDWSFCSCGAMEVFVAEDGYNSIGPARYPCKTVRVITAALSEEEP